MATLQKLRNKGSLLIAFVGIALFAFIAGDIVKLFQKAPEEPTVGTINGEEITISEFYTARNECEQAYMLLNNTTTLTESDQEAIAQMAWETLSNYKISVAQANEAGIKVTPEEISYVISSNSGNIASRYTSVLPEVFRTPTGAFNIEFINMIVNEYNNAIQQGMIPEDLQDLHDAWKFIEKQITCDIISTKLAQIYALASTTQNNAVAENNFNLNNNTYDVEIAAYPYSSYTAQIPAITDEEATTYYEANKAYRYEQPLNLYDIYYINHEVKPSSQDTEPLRAELEKYSKMLQTKDADINDIAIYSSTECPYDGFLWTIDALTANEATQKYENKFKEGHKFSLQQNAAGVVAAPFIDNSNNTYNLVMNVRKQQIPDSIKVRAIALQSESAEELKATADSLLTALRRKGSDFTKIAENYNTDTLNFKTKDFVYYRGVMPTPEAQTKIYTAKVGTYDIIEFGENAKLIFQVMEKKGSVEAYDPIIIERKIPTGTDTYSKEYDELSQFVTNCKNTEELQTKILSTKFRLNTQHSVNANNVNIAGITGTRDLLRWVVDANRQAGELSNIHEYTIGNKKYMMVAAIREVSPKGYVPFNKVKASIKNQLTNDKKAELISAEMNGKNIEQLKANQNVKVEAIDNIEYKKPTSVKAINSDEQVISAAVANMSAGETSAPIKGDHGVYVVKVLAKKAKNVQAMNANEESAYIQSQDFFNNPNVINQLVQDAVTKSHSTDNKVYQHM